MIAMGRWVPLGALLGLASLALKRRGSLRSPLQEERRPCYIFLLLKIFLFLATFYLLFSCCFVYLFAQFLNVKIHFYLLFLIILIHYFYSISQLFVLGLSSRPSEQDLQLIRKVDHPHFPLKNFH